MNLSALLVTGISLAVEIYIWLILARVFLSFVHLRRYHPLIGFIYRMTEPVLALCRRILPITSLGMDFSPFIAVIGLEIARAVAVYLINELLRVLGG